MRSFGWYYGSGLKSLIREAGRRRARIAIRETLCILVDVELVRVAEVTVHRGRVKVALGALWKHAARLAVLPLVHARRDSLGRLQVAASSAHSLRSIEPGGRSQSSSGDGASEVTW